MYKIVVATALSASLLLLPQPADARSGEPSPATWERLANCESGGRWQLRGKTYSGGLQFDARTWRSVGGKVPVWQTSSEEQIIRATILWRARGWKPWPGCSRKLHLR